MLVASNGSGNKFDGRVVSVVVYVMMVVIDSGGGSFDGEVDDLDDGG